MSTTIDDNFEEGVAVPGRYPGSPPIGVLPYYCFRHRRDQEGFTGRVQGHSTGITASRSSEVYERVVAGAAAAPGVDVGSAARARLVILSYLSILSSSRDPLSDWFPRITIPPLRVPPRGLERPRKRTAMRQRTKACAEAATRGLF